MVDLINTKLMTGAADMRAKYELPWCNEKIQ